MLHFNFFELMCILFLRFLGKPTKSLKIKALFIYCVLGAKVNCAIVHYTQCCYYLFSVHLIG